MPQLVPFYFINQVTFSFILFIVMIIFVLYMTPQAQENHIVFVALGFFFLFVCFSVLIAIFHTPAQLDTMNVSWGPNFDDAKFFVLDTCSIDKPDLVVDTLYNGSSLGELKTLIENFFSTVRFKKIALDIFSKSIPGKKVPLLGIKPIGLIKLKISPSFVKCSSGISRGHVWPILRKNPLPLLLKSHFVFFFCIPLLPFICSLVGLLFSLIHILCNKSLSLIYILCNKSLGLINILCNKSLGLVYSSLPIVLRGILPSAINISLPLEPLAKVKALPRRFSLHKSLDVDLDFSFIVVEVRDSTNRILGWDRILYITNNPSGIYIALLYPNLRLLRITTPSGGVNYGVTPACLQWDHPYACPYGLLFQSDTGISLHIRRPVVSRLLGFVPLINGITYSSMNRVLTGNVWRINAPIGVDITQ
uniref:hypothetical protein n=1 Tax=Ciborinia camelliae TaxID=647257 RepID=UPI001FA6F0B3|nr:hypothetical protein MRV96_mgp40 [Ciborinia camelliae]UNB14719.1 hypothetical protein [Ciborinia camelliae]